MIELTGRGVAPADLLRAVEPDQLGKRVRELELSSARGEVVVDHLCEDRRIAVPNEQLRAARKHRMGHSERIRGENQVAARALGISRGWARSTKRDVPTTRPGCDRSRGLDSLRVPLRYQRQRHEPRKQGDRRERDKTLGGCSVQLESFGEESLRTTRNASSSS